MSDQIHTSNVKIRSWPARIAGAQYELPEQSSSMARQEREIYEANIIQGGKMSNKVGMIRELPR
jgi:hypothetical protein